MLTSVTGSALNSLDLRGDAAEVLRYYSLPAAWKGRALRRLADTAIGDLGGDICALGTIEHCLLHRIVPEVARRLGDVGVPDTGAEMRMRDGFDLRHAAMSYMARAPMHDSPSWRFLVRGVTMGNPVAIALDLTCPPAIDGDWAAAQIRAAWTCFGLDRLTWGPDLLAAPAA